MCRRDRGGETIYLMHLRFMCHHKRNQRKIKLKKERDNVHIVLVLINYGPLLQPVVRRHHSTCLANATQRYTTCHSQIKELAQFGLRTLAKISIG